MSKREDFASRLHTYLGAGARKPAAHGLEERIRVRALGSRSSWALQLLAAAMVLVLAIGLSVGLRQARLLSAGGGPSPSPSVSPSASGSPSVKPTISPTPQAIPSPYPFPSLSSINMVSETTGWAAGSTTDRILRTSDGGAHWADVTPAGAELGDWTTFFLDGDHGWLATSHDPGSASPDHSVGFWRTANGGKTWEQSGRAMADNGFAAALDFIDLEHGWLFMWLGHGSGSEGVAFYGTSDGGATWTKLSETDSSGALGHLPLSCSKNRPVFVDRTTGWTPGACRAGDGPFLYATHDGGRTWRPVSLSLPAGYATSCVCQISSMRFFDARHGHFVLTQSTDAGQQSTLYGTSDGGATWRPVGPLPLSSFTAYFIDVNRGWILDAKANRTLTTTDGGQHWSPLAIVSGSNMVVEDIQFVSSQVGWALAPQTGGEAILKTLDGGLSWTVQLSPTG